MQAMSAAPDALIFAQWEDVMVHHPGLYLAQRWPVFRWTVAAPDVAQCHPAFAGIEGDPADLESAGTDRPPAPAGRRPRRLCPRLDGNAGSVPSGVC